ncbi:hypothetical protein KEM54_000039 [Ascosphaera aggregata]|nr:hypothetical protein KEM54_000039 [Ascosphaera aggregata]
MPLPPGQIRIKRRREDEPVETLCKLYSLPSVELPPLTGHPSPDIQSHSTSDEFHSRRRFTDFIFKRIKKRDDSAAASNPLSSISSPSTTSLSPSSSHGHLRAASAAAALRSKQQQPAAITTARSRDFPPIIKSSAADSKKEDQPESVPNQGISINALDSRPSSSAIAAHHANSSTTSIPFSRLKNHIIHRHSHSSSSSLKFPPTSTPPSYLNIRKFHLATSSIHRHANSSSTYSVPTSASNSKVDLLHRSNSAILKRSSGRDKWSTTAVVIEKKLNQPASTTTSTTTPAAAAAAAGVATTTTTKGSNLKDSQLHIAAPSTSTVPATSQPRKRPIINEAEKKFRQQQQEILKARKERNARAATASSSSLSQPPSKSHSHSDQDRLAQELEQLALQMASYAQAQATIQDAYLPMLVPTTTTTTSAAITTATNNTPVTTTKPKLKYQPKPLIRRQGRQSKLNGGEAGPATIEDVLASGSAVRNASAGEYVTSTAPPTMSGQQTDQKDEIIAMKEPEGGIIEKNDNVGDDDDEDEDEDGDDGEYVYDTFIRQPADHDLSQPQIQQPLSSAGYGSTPEPPPRNIGIVVITDEDAPYWEEYLDTGNEEDEAKDWASEDEDSNAEDYFANEYPEEEDSEDGEREGKGLWYDDDDDDEQKDAYIDSDGSSDYGNRVGGYRRGIRDFSDDDEGYY